MSDTFAYASACVGHLSAGETFNHGDLPETPLLRAIEGESFTRGGRRASPGKPGLIGSMGGWLIESG
jgi:hypothetical protein